MNKHKYKNLLLLRPGDLFIKNRVILREQFVIRALFFLKNCLYKKHKTSSNQQVQSEFSSVLEEMIELMNQMPLEKPDPYLIKDFLVIEAKLLLSKQRKELANLSLFHAFQEKLEAKHALVKKFLKITKAKYPLELKRWIESSEFQRKFACYNGYQEVPLKVEEIPPGAILLTNVHSLIRGLRIQGKRVQKKHWFLLFKAYMFQLFTGSPLIHAELSLGNGQFFHLDNKRKIFQCIIKEVQKDKVCFQYDILFPNKEKILTTFRKNNQKYPVKDFKQFMELLIHEAKSRGVRVKIRSYKVILKIGMSWRQRFPLKRRKAWHPEKIDYTCSGTISALFAHFGVDFARFLKKIPDDLSPADLKKTSFFLPFHKKQTI